MLRRLAACRLPAPPPSCRAGSEWAPAPRRRPRSTGRSPPGTTRGPASACAYVSTSDCTGAGSHPAAVAGGISAPPQLGKQRGRCRPARRVAVAGMPRRLPELRRNAVQVGLGVHRAVHQGGGLAVAEGPAARSRRSQHRPEREDVARRPDVLAGDLLGGQESGRTEERARRRELGALERLGDAEVDDAWAVRAEQDVGRLEVAVDEARGVDRDERLGESGGEPAYGGLGQGAVLGDRLLQAGAGDVLRREPGPVGVGVGVDDRGGPEPADRAGHLDLAAEALAEIRVVGQLGPRHLHRDRPPARRESEVDGAHGAAPSRWWSA